MKIILKAVCSSFHKQIGIVLSASCRQILEIIIFKNLCFNMGVGAMLLVWKSIEIEVPC